MGLVKIRKNSYMYAQNKTVAKINVKIIIVVINIVVATFILYIFAMINKFMNISKVVVILIAILFVIYFISTFIILFFYNSYIKREADLQNKSKELSQIKEYTDMIETMYSELRKFKHDYVNIISAINGYIEGKDMEGLQRYFNTHIIPLNENINLQNSRIESLKYINDTALKGLLSSKLVQAQSKEGFSTKGEKRGIGLYNVREILNSKYRNVILNTSVGEWIFKQELIIGSSTYK